MSNLNIIVNFLGRRKDEHFCDDCLSSVTDICPRQQVNQICRRLSDPDFPYKSGAADTDLIV